jgi:hypothetical protein
MACLKSFSSLFNEFRLKNAVVVAEEGKLPETKYKNLAGNIKKHIWQPNIDMCIRRGLLVFADQKLFT